MDMDPHIDRALACLIEGIQTRAMPSSAFSGSDEGESIVQDVKLLQLSYETLGQRMRHHIANMARRFNSRAPINQLPNELLIKIFSLTLTPILYRVTHNPRHLAGLCLVSTDWNKAITETPSLWAKISSGYSDRENWAAMERSKGCLLRVDYSDDHRGRRDADRAAFLDFAIQEAYRWQSAELTIFDDRTVALLPDLVPLSVPNLEELTIYCAGEELSAEMKTINIFSGGTDRLRHLSLMSFYIPWSSRLLSRLETLRISGPTLRPGPSANEVIDILRRCPELRVFDFEYLDQEIHVSGAAPSEAEVVHLPALSSFMLKVNNAEAFGRIISSIRIPGCTKFALECVSLTNNIFQNEARHLTAALLSAIQSIPVIELTLSTHDLMLNPDSSVVDIVLTSNSPWEDLAWLIEATTPSVLWPPIHARIFLSDSLPFHQLAGLLRSLPSITELELVGNSDQYIALLSHPTLNNGIYEWVLPNLRKISFEDCPENSPQLLVDLSGKRQTGGDMDRGDGVPSGLPMKLEKIHVMMPDRNMGREAYSGALYTALRELKGDLWDGLMKS